MKKGWVSSRWADKEKEPEASLGSLVGAVLGLVTFILAFTFGMTASRFEVRRQLVLDEASAIGTTYLRAGLLPESQGEKVRRLRREYVEVRVKVNIDNINDGAAHDVCLVFRCARMKSNKC